MRHHTVVIDFGKEEGCNDLGSAPTEIFLAAFGNLPDFLSCTVRCTLKLLLRYEELTNCLKNIVDGYSQNYFG